jgi:hypothetical protein
MHTERKVGQDPTHMMVEAPVSIGLEGLKMDDVDS